ncbi:hypothetical protein BS47DRAFT_1391255 [Hydnum rufescens UP504]|uniref:Structural maintenance of chromosomes protein 4 n=1 Tax=Hydnum rufescens UP504 TaxID=1448309 RepID=A0A9P6B435_9AGAM|nr:hypothetical protein BS47DRAFT_1391255 [Hydnum rufescens UP504]
MATRRSTRSKPASSASAAGANSSVKAGDAKRTPNQEDLSGSDNELEPTPSTSKRARTSSSKAATSSRSATRSTKSVAESIPEEQDNGEGDNTSDQPPKRTARKPRATSSKPAPKRKTTESKSRSSRRVVAPLSDPEESEQDGVPSPVVKVEVKSTSLSKQNGNSGRRAPRVIVGFDEEENESDAPPHVIPETVAQVDEPEPSAPERAPVPEEERPSSEEEDLIPRSSIRASIAPPSRIGRGSVPPISRVGHTSISGPRPSVVPKEPEIDPGPKARLVIHKMALVNFKSYKGRQEIGPFHKSFSSIVGPNGSGKSNTIDALLFVFGYRASKMRQGKLSELIHNSSARAPGDEGSEDDSHPEFNSCSVEVHFREIIDLPGPDDFEVVPNSKLVVARTAYRNNKSEYTINGNASNFTEVTSLLKGRGIDLDHKRFLILQGEVESIAQMKPKAPSEHEDGLLEYLEDIIGTSKYKAPIEECNEEVEKLNEDRGARLTRLRHVEKEKSRLEEAKREVEDALKDLNALARAKSALAQHYIWQSLKNAEASRRDISKLEQQLVQEVEKNKDNLAESETLQEQYEDRAAQYDVVKKETAKLVKDLASHEKEEVKLQEKKKHVSSKQKKLKKAIADDGHAKSDADATIEASDLEKEEHELEAIQESLKAKQKELAPWTAKVNIKQAEIDLAESERALLADKATGAQAAVDEAIQGLEKLKADKAVKEEELETLNVEREGLKKQIKAGESKFRNVEEQTDRLRSKASGARQRVEEAKANQAASTSQNAVLDSLTRLRAAGRIHGFHGRLGSLGTIPEKYDVAISTACPALNNLVVDTVDQGQACIDYLRKQNVGRASFLVLEKLPADGRLDKIATPENVPRLFDLVKPKDPKFAAAFFKGLGNTLVAEDLDQANRIAYGQQKRWRVVTLAGQLFDTSGTMSGGGTKVAKGGMSSKLASDAVQPAVMKQYEAENGKLQGELDALIAERRAFETELDGLQKQLPKVDMAISKAELDIRTADKWIMEAEKRIKELNAHSKPNASDVKRIKALEAEIASSTAEVEKLREKSGAIESDISTLQDKILEIGGVRLRSQKSKVEGIKQQIDHVNEQITKAELDAELEALAEELETCSRDLADVRAQVEKAQEIADSAKEDLGEMKAELDEKMILINQFRAKEVYYVSPGPEQGLREEDAKVHHWTQYHDALELHEIDEDEEEEEPSEPTEKNAEANEQEHSVVKEELEAAPKTSKKSRTESMELEVFSDEALASFDLSELKGDVATLEERVKNAKPNMGLLEEYRKREAEFLTRAKDLEDVTAARDAAKDRFDKLRKTRLDEFMAGFNAISSKLKEMYQMITLGGNAELELVDSLDPFSEGIIFSVMPPKKSWKNISNLSGGEKTLSSLALVFALHVFKPTPLYFMDEIDAALDFRNVSIVANYIKDRTKNAQFIIISLRNDMFELSHRLIGIYKTSNATRSTQQLIPVLDAQLTPFTGVSIDNHVLSPIANQA